MICYGIKALPSKEAFYSKSERRCNFNLRNGKNPNYEQKKRLAKAKKDWTQWLLIKNNKDSYEFRHKETGETLTLTK